MKAETVVEISDKLPMKHKAAKLVISTVVGFIASSMAEFVYDATLEAYRKKMASRREV